MPELPQDFVQNMIGQLGDDNAAQLFYALDHTDSPVSVRPNPFKPLDLNQHFGEKLSSVLWSSMGRYLPCRPQFTLDPLFHAGCYYVQEASSMFIEQAWNTIKSLYPAQPLAVLDLCAAPGGKSTLWRSILPDDTLLVANEPDRKRAEILNENLIKWGHPHVMVTNAYAADFAENAPKFFDIVAADVPCSGEGMFRKDPQSRNEWSLSSVERCASLQREIIRDVWPALKEGGFLVYSTCTYNSHEDEYNVRWIQEELGAEFIELQIDPMWGLTTTSSGYHFYPHRAQGEGFFLALLRKPGTPSSKGSRAHLERIRHFDWAPYDIKGKKQIPQHVLAMNPDTAQDYPHYELNKDEALRYLRREALNIDAPRGYVIVCYEGHPLGFVNNLGTRANNLYPQEWRIRHL